MNNFKRVVMALALMSTAPAFAQVYVTGQVSRAEQKASLDGESIKESATGGSIAVGYQVAPNFAVEGGYAGLGEVSASDVGAKVTSKPTLFYGALVGSVQVAPAIALHAKVGISRAKTDVTASYLGQSVSGDSKKTHGVFAVGAAYAFNEKLAAVAEYTYYGKIAEESGLSLKASAFSAGLRYSF